MQRGQFQVSLEKRLSIDAATVEIWYFLRDDYIIRYLVGNQVLEFPALFSGKLSKLYYTISIPAAVIDGQQQLSDEEVAKIASNTHLALSRAGIRNVIQRQGQFEPWSASKREVAWSNFRSHMSSLGWRIEINKVPNTISLSHGLFTKPRPAQTDDEMLCRARLVADAFEALHDEPHDFRVLHISDRTSHSTVAYVLNW